MQEEETRNEKQLEALQAEIEDQQEKVRASSSEVETERTTSLLKELIEMEAKERESREKFQPPVKILVSATFNEEPTSPNIFITGGIGLLVGGLISLFLLSQRVPNANQIEPG